ncbi:MAG TPA: terminase small subunit [Chromatiales bacterium]|nr:terminase small subunit [Chromatiales bacterium]
MSNTKGATKREAFIAHLLADPELSGINAARAAGYKNPSVSAAQLLKREDVQQEVAEEKGRRAERMSITQDEVVNDLRELRDMCMARKPVEREVMAEGVPMTVESRIFNAAGAKGAIELLGKHLGMFTDKVEHSGAVDIRQLIEDVAGEEQGNPLRRVVEKDAG